MQLRPRPARRVCPWCRDVLAAAPTVDCAGCATTLHQECRSAAAGCTTLGCAERGSVVAEGAVRAGAPGASGRAAAGEAPTWGGAAPLQPPSGAGCWQLLHLGFQCLELAGMVLMAVLWLLTLGSH